jgi:ATP-dependent RNA helicase DDX41
MFCLEQECAMPFAREEGPFGLIICPSRELARQTASFFTSMSASGVREGFPELRVLACIGGDPLKSQVESIKRYNQI